MAPSVTTAAAEPGARPQPAGGLLAVIASAYHPPRTAYLYGPTSQEGMPAGWVDGFRAMVATEPGLHGVADPRTTLN